MNGRLGPQRLRALVEAMNQTMVHRGPDDAGVWVDPTGRCALAQRRLSIVDLSPLGHQPMVDDTGQIGLTFNGEIYNFRELRRRLESQGRRFRSQCDAEVLVHLLAEQHEDRLDALRGMYALAIWNARQRRLMLARDPLGKKPLYIARGRGWFAFASELRALEVIDDLDRTVSPEALADYLLLQYFHAPRTIYRGVEKLEPGCWMLLDDQGRERSGRHFCFDAGSGEPGVQLAGRYEDRVEQLDALLTQAVQRRLMSDVPLGAFLSGGIDSALVVSRMRRLGVHTKTYSVGFADSPDSEHVQAREIAAHLGCEHHDIVLKPDAIELAPMIAASLDEPNGDSSCLPTYLLSEFTRRYVTVALSGDGGDEMFGGYGRYFDTLADVAGRGGAKASDLYLGPRLTIFQPPDLVRFLGEVPAATRAGIDAWSADLDRADRPLIHRMRNMDVQTYLPGAVLAKVDRMSMRHSLEVRCPLLDFDVARFAAALGEDDLVTEAPGGWSGKRILKDLLTRELPAEWVHRRKKGFGLPSNFWDGPALRTFAHEVLAGPDTCLADWLDHGQLKAWLMEQENPQCFSIYRLWPVLMLELWLRGAREGRGPAPEPLVAAGARRGAATAAGS
ncbi:MAG: asparagine synthase (glutamine-hydrolyzing) [Phycisphaerales bacterium]|nr:asparagine synthase (glutamine-hydrolyzing) [Phycisphaerales bacterium]